MEQQESIPPPAPAPAPIDPYAPPTVPVGAPVFQAGPEAPLASPWPRLGAQILNGVVLIPAIICFSIAMSTADPDTETLTGVGIALLAVALIYAIVIIVLNIKLLAREGQSLGKKWMKLRVVRRDGSRATLGRLIGLRYFVNSLLGSVPLLGPVYTLVDWLFVFREDRRTIHDMFSDTKVVEAR